jgi:hypothetical protein
MPGGGRMLAVRFPINRDTNSPQNRKLQVEFPFLPLRRFRAKTKGIIMNVQRTNPYPPTSETSVLSVSSVISVLIFHTSSHPQRSQPHRRPRKQTKTPRHFNISTTRGPKTLGHFKDFNPNPTNLRPFQLFKHEIFTARSKRNPIAT